jgi:hypothetical protein
MEGLLEALIEAKPNENGHYFPLFDEAEGVLIQQIEKDAQITQVNKSNASRLLFITWEKTRLLVQFRNGAPSPFLDEASWTMFIDKHPNIIPLLVEVHTRKAYSWLFSNRM